MNVSIIVPVYNNANVLAECLAALKPLDCSRTEIIVVDDASTDDTSLVAANAGVRLVRLLTNSGPSAARNCGAGLAEGEILFFVDADVILAPGALNRVENAFQQQPEIAAVFGSYDAHPRGVGVISQYRNLLHHFVHQNGHSEASTFWAGCGAIRKSVFEKIGGFDQKRFPYPSIEDIELGYRLREAGYRILLDKSLQGTHLKRWTLRSFVKTDIVRRAIPWSRLIVETRRIPNDLNLKWDQRASFVLAALACLLLAFGAYRIEFLALSSIAILTVLVLNRKLYQFFFRKHGLLFALSGILLHLFYYLYSGFSYLYVRVDPIYQTFPKLDRLALGFSTGIVNGALFFMATVILLLKGGEVVGPHLKLVGEYFPGYSVSVFGSMLALSYGFASGFIGGWGFALLRNTAVFVYMALIYHRVEREIL